MLKRRANRPARARPLITTLLLAWALSLLLCGTLTAVAFTLQIATRLEALAIDRGETLLAMLERQLETAQRAGDFERVAGLIEGLDQVEQLRRVALYHQPLQIYLETGQRWPHAINQPPSELGRRVYAANLPEIEFMEDSIRLARPVRTGPGGRVEGVLTIDLVRPDRVALLTDLLSDKAPLAFAAVLGTLGIAAAFARSLVRPIEAATRMADRVARGELVPPEPIGGGLEATRLETSLRLMVQRLQESQDQIRDLAFRDQVTRLPNRADFSLRGRKVLRSGMAVGARHALLFIDLDGFKEVNDTHGHDVGDQALCHIADRLRETLRPGDEIRAGPLLARLGGDEFTVLLGNLRCAADAEAVADRILGALAGPIEVQGHVLRLGASIGIAVTDSTVSDSFSELMRRADVAMYAVKAQGKNGWKLYEPGLERQAA